jgi:alcohol dehydrogenase
MAPELKIGPMESYFNPVRVHFGPGSVQQIPPGPAFVITSPGVIARGDLRSVEAAAEVEGVYSDVQPNPTLAAVMRAAATIGNIRATRLIAIGGGSVIDTCKAVAAQMSTGPQWLERHFTQGEKFPEAFQPPEIIAVPTTAGTGSEVTMWATIWDDVAKQKYSLSHPALYPKMAIVDPALTVSAGEELTVTAGLDALSHAMESVWNRSANTVSDTLAERAIRLIVRTLPRVIESPRDLALRTDLNAGSLLAGLAFSNTRTALAHSISYPLTAELGVPHGLACSLTLPEILRLNGAHRLRLRPILSALDCSDTDSGARAIDDVFGTAGLERLLRKYLPDAEAVHGIRTTFINPGRAENNITAVDHEGAKKVLIAALARLGLVTGVVPAPAV